MKIRSVTNCIKLFVATMLTWSVSGAELVATHDNYTAQKMIARYQDAIAGVNLAAGRPVSFAPTPDYHITKVNGTDATDLTDGRIIEDSQEIWRFKEAVGWQVVGNKSIIIDLGKEQNVGKVVWRVVAGAKKLEFTGPKRVRIYGSRDGQNASLLVDYHRESLDLAAKNIYSLPNIGPITEGTSPYVYPLEIPVGNWEMRYIIVNFDQDSVWFTSDELAVMAGNGIGKSMDKLPTVKLQTSDVWITSPETRLPIVENINLPLYLTQTDCRENGANYGVTYKFELPDGVEMTIPNLYKSEQNGNNVTYRHNYGGNKLIGPVFFTCKTSLEGPAIVKLQAIGDNAQAQPEAEITLYPATMPSQAPSGDDLVLGIAWMTDIERQFWPDVLAANQAVGFNMMTTFPSAWISNPIWKGELKATDIRKASDPSSLTEFGKQIAEYRRAGMKILMVYSPLHIINWTFPNAKKEYTCQGTDAGVMDAFCAAYTGEYYQKEIESVGLCYEGTGGVDYIMWDTELWGTSRMLANHCTRCQAAFKKSGERDMDTWFAKQIQRVYRDLDASIAQVATRRGWKKPKISLYSLSVNEPYECGMTMRNMPMFDFQNPSLYVGDDPQIIHDKVRFHREGSGKSNIFPWLTTGTYGYVTPINAKVMVMENFFNGAFGGGYYEVKDMNPAHYLAIAEGFSALTAIAKILRNGTPAHETVSADNPAIRLSAIKHDGKTAILAVNTTDAPQRVKIKLIDDSDVKEQEIAPKDAKIVVFEK